MKTGIKEFSISTSTDTSDLGKVISYRQQVFSYTVEYVKVQKVLRAVIQQLRDYGIDIEILNDLEDSIGRIECIFYSDAYRAGMTDLMTALTFNNLNITDAEYLVCEDQEGGNA